MKRTFLRLFVVLLLVVGGNKSVIAQDYAVRIKADSLLKQAIKLNDSGKPKEALPLIEEAATIKEVGVMMTTNIQIAALNIYVNLGMYADALRAFHRALDSASDKAKADQVRLMGGEVFFQMGNYKAGYDMLSAVDTDSLLVRRDIQLSRMLYGLDRSHEAILLLTTSYAANKDVRFTNTILQNIGYLYWATGDLKSADEYMTKALSNLHPQQNAREYNTVLENRAMIHSQQGRHQEAIAEMSATLDYFCKYTNNYQISLRKYAEVLTRAGKSQKAKSYFERYFREEQNKIVSNLSQMTRQQKLNLWAKERPLLSKCFMLEKSAAEFLFEVAMFRRQISLISHNDTMRVKRLLSATPTKVRQSLKANEAAVELVRYSDLNGEEWYAAIVLPKIGAAQFVKLLKIDDVYEPEVVGNNSLYNAIKREDKTEINILYSNKDLGNKIWMPILSSLPNGVNRLFFAPEGIFHMWGVENMPFDGKNRMELCRVSSIASLIDSEELQCADFGGLQKLVIGGLDYNVAPTDTVSVRTPNREAREMLCMRVGDIRHVFQYLKGTEIEADSVARICKTIARRQIGELTLKSIMGNFGLVHIATHGYSLSCDVAPNPEFLLGSIKYDRSLSSCGVVLTGANVSTNANYDDGILSAREICDLDLSNVDFVVLSACQTAKGDVLDDGAAGLVRGLKSAGVKTVLATLWSVDDTSTILFMKEFYTLLSDGKTPYQAQRLAQNNLAKKSRTLYYRQFSPKTLASERKQSVRKIKYDTPYYYAPFILIDAN